MSAASHPLESAAGPAARARRTTAGVVPLLALAGVLATAPPSQAGALRDDLDLLLFARRAQVTEGPWREVRRELAAAADRPWRWGVPGGRYATVPLADGGKSCAPTDTPGRSDDYLKNAAPDAYVRALAARTADRGQRSMRWLLEVRTHLLRVGATRGFHGPDGRDASGANQCVLDLAVSVPVWIATAELLEGSGIWGAAERERFAAWLAEEVYPRVAWASRVRRNNWGAAGSVSARMIARYVEPSGRLLAEDAPVPRLIAPARAVLEHDRMQHLRVGRQWRGDSRCSVYGIQTHGGIPDELRRGAGGCSATALSGEGDAGHTYQTMQAELLILHAEVLRREGDASLYEAPTAAGEPALRQATLFVIDNPAGGASWDWGVRTGALRVAYRYYGDDRLADQVRANAHRGFRGGRSFPYTQVHPAPSP